MKTRSFGHSLRFDCKYEFDYEHDFLAFELEVLTARSLAILVVKQDGHKI